jgi:hypothetical protein
VEVLRQCITGASKRCWCGLGGYIPSSPSYMVINRGVVNFDFIHRRNSRAQLEHS